jgi:hypothetical protein
MNNESQNATSLLTINTTINTSKNTKTLNLKPVKKPTFKPPRKTMSTPTLSLESTYRIRKDIFGEIIKKGGKQKISFADDELFCVHENKEDSEIMSEPNNKKVKKVESTLIEIIDVVSYKEQNKNNVFKANKEIDTEDVCCESCQIF